MATVLTHAALPFIVARVLPVREGLRRPLALTAAVIACVPDLDVASAVLDAQGGSWGHRGVTHSLLFALGLAAIGVAVLRLWREPPAATVFLVAMALSHGLIDAFTHGEPGPMLLAPFSGARWLFPWGPIAVSPLGINEMFGRYGALAFFSEVLVVLAPAWLATAFVKGDEDGRPRVLVAAAAWAVITVGVAVALPGLLVSFPRRLEAYASKTTVEPLGWVPVSGLPEQRLVTKFSELAARGLFEVELKAAAAPWSSSFFPSWYGGDAGRWQDARWALVWRTVRGYTPPAASELETADAAALSKLAPLEKYDVAAGDYALSAERQTLKNTHNGSPRFWHGLCNGVAGAALFHPEPFRAVDVVNPRGQKVRFLPNDVRALLGASYFWMSEIGSPFYGCDRIGLDSGAACSLNAGAAVIAAVNRLGLAHEGFLVDVFPSKQMQFYAVGAGKVAVRRAPYPFDGRETSKALAGKVAQLVDVELSLTGSSTTLGYAPGNVPEPGSDGTRFQKIGMVGVPFSWPATLALSADGEIIGGVWTGAPADGPDTYFFIGGGPQLVDGEDTLAFNPHVRWPFIQRLAAASADPGDGVPTIEGPAIAP